MKKNRIITVQDIPITITQDNMDDYICITNIAAAKSEHARAADVVRNWLRNRTTLEFLATWEEQIRKEHHLSQQHFWGGMQMKSNFQKKLQKSTTQS